MATLPLKSSNKQQPSVIRLLWAKRLSANAIQSEMRPKYGNKYLTRPAIHVWCKSLLIVEKVLLMSNDLVAVVSTTDATIAAVDSLVRSNRRVMG